MRFLDLPPTSSFKRLRDFTPVGGEREAIQTLPVGSRYWLTSDGRIEFLKTASLNDSNARHLGLFHELYGLISFQFPDVEPTITGPTFTALLAQNSLRYIGLQNYTRLSICETDLEKYAGKKLDLLCLSGCAVTDNCVGNIAKNLSVNWLLFRGNHLITDRSYSRLLKIKHLTRLDLRETSISAETKAKLRMQLPNTEIQ